MNLQLKRVTTLFLTWEFFVLFLLCVASFVIRAYKINELLTITYDQGRDLFFLEGITQGDLKLVGPTTGIAGVFLGPYFYYFLLPGFVLAYGNPVGVVLWQILGICLSLLFFYFLLKPYLGKWWALIGYFLLVINPGSIEQSRQIWNPSLTVMTMLPAVYFLFTSLKKPWLLAVSTLLFGLALQTELAYVIFLMPLGAGWILYFNHLQHQTLQPALYSWKVLLVSALLFGATVVPQLAFEVKNDLMMSKAILTEIQDPARKVPLSQVWRYRPHALMAELNDSLTAKAPGSRYLLWAVFAISVINLVMVWERRHEPKFQPIAPLLLFWSAYFWLPLIGMMFHTGNYGNFFNYYVTAHYLPMIAMVVIFLSQLKFQRITASALVSLYIVIFARYAFFIYDTSIFQFSLAHQINALKHARELKTQTDTPIEMYVGNGLPKGYEYVNHWLEKTGQVEPMHWTMNGNDEYIVMYEPFQDKTTRFFFLKWRQEYIDGHNCTGQKSFGIIKIRKCYKVSK
ncbi:MAG TPA: hypothetical protein VF209_01395 [Patescibacteria group bacterium]